MSRADHIRVDSNGIKGGDVSVIRRTEFQLVTLETPCCCFESDAKS
jgi:hypothetical protein